MADSLKAQAAAATAAMFAAKAEFTWACMITIAAVNGGTPFAVAALVRRIPENRMASWVYYPGIENGLELQISAAQMGAGVYPKPNESLTESVYGLTLTIVSASLDETGTLWTLICLVSIP